MGITERFIIIIIALIVILVSSMLFMLGLFFLKYRQRSEEFFLKPFPEQMKSLGFFRDVPFFGSFYYNIGIWYMRTFPQQQTSRGKEIWSGSASQQPSWLNHHTVKYFVFVVGGMLIAYSIVTALVAVGGIYAMIQPFILLPIGTLPFSGS